MKNTHQHLSYKDRPEELKVVVENSFKAVSQDTVSSWGIYNGSVQYNLFGNNSEYKILDKYVCSSMKKEFYVLDIGAGNFQFSNALVKHIQANSIYNQKIVHIFSIRGELNKDIEVINHSNIFQYNFGSFAIENIECEFIKRGFDMKGKIDFAVSHFTFLHFADPLGTFVQVFDLLNENAILTTDTFRYNIKSTGDNLIAEDKYSSTLMLAGFLIDMGHKVLLHDCSSGRSYPRIAVKKCNNKDLEIPLEYFDINQSNIKQNAANCIITFKPIKLLPHYQYNEFGEDDDYFGDKALYEFIDPECIITKKGIPTNICEYVGPIILNEESITLGETEVPYYELT